MNTETFRAPDMMAALENIQRKLGSDAVVLSVREVFDESCWKVWKKPGVEVKAGIRERSSDKPSLPLIPEKPAQDDPIETPAQSQEPLKTAPVIRHIQPSSLYKEQSGSDESRPQQPLYKVVRESLSSQDIIHSLLDEITRTCLEVLPPQIQGDMHRVESFIQDLISAELRVMPEIQVGKSGVICLVGSSGSGKTSTTAKLAAKFSQEDDREVVWIAADTYRAGAIAEAKAYTETMGIRYYPTYSSEELADLVADLRDDHLILVDLFDSNPFRKGNQEMLETYLKALGVAEIYLVLPATTKLPDVLSIVESYQELPIRGIIPTKLDETRAYGTIISGIWQSGLPLVYCSNGPSVLDDLQAPDPDVLARNIIIAPAN